MRRSPDGAREPVTVSDVGILVAAAAIVLAVAVGYGEVAYGDWTCAFKKCVVVVDHRDTKPEKEQP